jgi:hypothetical protein
MDYGVANVDHVLVLRDAWVRDSRVSNHRSCLDIASARRDAAGGASKIKTMTRDELIIQLIKIGLGGAIGIYFVWWSLEVLHRLPIR